VGRVLRTVSWLPVLMKDIYLSSRPPRNADASSVIEVSSLRPSAGGKFSEPADADYPLHNRTQRRPRLQIFRATLDLLALC